MDLDQIKYMYFIGIGGIGMSALARYFRAEGKSIAGYDRTPTPLTDKLGAEGIDIHFTDDVKAIPEACRDSANRALTLVVVTPAIPPGHEELRWFQKNGYSVVKRAEVLGLITAHAHTVAIAGTHGKTTTTSIVAHLLHAGGIACDAFLGGISKNFGSNLLLSDTGDRTSRVVVVEADEYDYSFHHLRPHIAVITSMDADHLDIYGHPEKLADAYRQFAGQTRGSGTIIHRQGLDLRIGNHKCYTYSISGPADFTAQNIAVRDNRYCFDLSFGGRVLESLMLGTPGRHNLENALAALAVAVQFEIGDEKLREALNSYAGVHRRFDFQLRHPKITFVDDYAHHPAEVAACIAGLRELYPEKKITGIFQPHLYSRTRDFADGFAKSLSLLDELILLDIYPAREEPIPGVTSEMIFSRMKLSAKVMCKKSELPEVLSDRYPEVLVTMGAGDVDALVSPVKQLLMKKYNI